MLPAIAVTEGPRTTPFLRRWDSAAALPENGQVPADDGECDHQAGGCVIAARSPHDDGPPIRPLVLQRLPILDCIWNRTGAARVEARPVRHVAEGEGRILSRISALLWVVTLGGLIGAALAWPPLRRRPCSSASGKLG